MRILITGSREWTDTLAIAVALTDARYAAGREPHEVTVVHGGAKGADSTADSFARVNGYNVEVHPVTWRPHGVYNPHAGKARNSEMVVLGADICLAFIKDGSPGATDCAEKAEAAGIKTVRYEA